MRSDCFLSPKVKRDPFNQAKGQTLSSPLVPSLGRDASEIQKDAPLPFAAGPRLLIWCAFGAWFTLAYNLRLFGNYVT